MEQEQGLNGLNGFWSWLKRQAQKVADLCSDFGLDSIATSIEDALASVEDFSAGKINYVPTASEGVILDAWADSKLIPFYQKLLIQIKLAFESTNYTFQLQQINEIEMKMCVVKSFYKTHETTNLSSNAVNLRSDLINTVFRPLEQMILDSITGDSIILQAYSFTVNNPALFLPLNINNTTVDCERYIDNNGGYGNSQSLLTPSPVVISPTTNQVIPNITTTGNVKSNDNSNVLFVLLGILGLTLLFYPGENEASDHNVKKKKQNNQIEKA